MTGLGWVAVLATTAAVAAGVAVVAPPPRRLAGRVRPYTAAARTSLGRPADVPTWRSVDGSPVRRVLWPLLEPLARVIGERLDPTAEAALARKLRQADFLSDRAPAQRLLEFRVRTLAHALAGAVLAGFAGSALVDSRRVVLLLVVAGLVAGWGRQLGRLDRIIEDRRERMRVELYTVNQLLAMHVRVGGGVVQALQRVVDRGNGLVVAELAAALHLHASGRDLPRSLEAAADATPEPTAARTYRLLATGATHGADLATSLLEHADDVRQARREAIERQATRRRATMLVPIIAVLAPVMLLFIAAPLPSIVLGVR